MITPESPIVSPPRSLSYNSQVDPVLTTFVRAVPDVPIRYRFSTDSKTRLFKRGVREVRRTNHPKPGNCKSDYQAAISLRNRSVLLSGLLGVSPSLRSSRAPRFKIPHSSPRPHSCYCPLLWFSFGIVLRGLTIGQFTSVPSTTGVPQPTRCLDLYSELRRHTTGSTPCLDR